MTEKVDFSGSGDFPCGDTGNPEKSEKCEIPGFRAISKGIP